MKKIIPFLLLACFCTLFSCGKLPANGLLDGQWQLMEISTKETPTDSFYSETINKKGDRTYWSFQLDLLSIRMPSGEASQVFARFLHEGKTLDINKTYIHFRTRDSLLTDPNTTVLEPAGIKGNAEKFHVDELNRQRMVLTTDIKRLVFRKF